MGQKEFPRHNRVNEEIQRTLGPLIQELRDPRLGLTTITGVEVTRDYSIARVFVSVLNSDDAPSTIKALTHAGGYLRRKLAQATAMRTTPRLRFVYDDSMARSDRIDRLIDQGLPRE